MKKNILLLLILSVLFSVTGCTSANTKIQKSGFYLDTVINITVYGTKDESLLDDAFALCNDYEQMFSRTIEGSDVWNINHSGGKSVTVSDETIFLLEKALYYSELSDGAYDCTIAPLSILWNFQDNTGTLPADAELEKALNAVDYRQLIIEGNQVTLPLPNAAIDLGSIAKGYIADRMKEFLQERGVKSALINLGGNVITLGDKPDGTPWNIGIQKPFSERNETIETAKLTDTSLVTSGVYERYFNIGDKLYHHILSPSTGYPIENNLYSVTIRTASSTDADALSTACFALGLEEGMKLAESLPDVEALFITDDYELHYSSGF